VPGAVLAVTALLVVLVVAGVAAREGPYTAPLPPRAAAPTTGGATTVPSRPPVATASTTPTPETADAELPPSPLLGEILLGLTVLLGLAAAAWLARTAVRTGHDLSRRATSLPPSVGESVRSALEPAAREALREVEQPDAREAVVRSWLLLGAAAAAAGLPAGAAETAAEYAARIVAELGVPGPELDRLADLYREARFSEHEVGEAQRTEARELLRRLHDRLGHVPA